MIYKSILILHFYYSYSIFFLNLYLKSPYYSGSDIPCNKSVFNPTLRGMAGKFEDTISIFNRKRNSVKMNISGFAKIFHEQMDEIL